MGMMNNSYFRIHVHRTLDEAGLPALRFQHPTLAGPGNFGGWFEEQVLGKQGEAPKAAAGDRPRLPETARDCPRLRETAEVDGGGKAR